MILIFTERQKRFNSKFVGKPCVGIQEGKEVWLIRCWPTDTYDCHIFNVISPKNRLEAWTGK